MSEFKDITVQSFSFLRGKRSLGTIPGKEFSYPLATRQHYISIQPCGKKRKVWVQSCREDCYTQLLQDTNTLAYTTMVKERDSGKIVGEGLSYQWAGKAQHIGITLMAKGKSVSADPVISVGRQGPDKPMGRQGPVIPVGNQGPDTHTQQGINWDIKECGPWWQGLVPPLRKGQGHSHILEEHWTWQ